MIRKILALSLLLLCSLPSACAETFIVSFGDGLPNKYRTLLQAEWKILEFSAESDREAVETLQLLRFNIKMLNDGRGYGSVCRLYLEGEVKDEKLVLKSWYLLLPFADEDASGKGRLADKLGREHFANTDIDGYLPPHGDIKLADNFDPAKYARTPGSPAAKKEEEKVTKDRAKDE